MNRRLDGGPVPAASVVRVAAFSSATRGGADLLLPWHRNLSDPDLARKVADYATSIHEPGHVFVVIGQRPQLYELISATVEPTPEHGWRGHVLVHRNNALAARLEPVTAAWLDAQWLLAGLAAESVTFDISKQWDAAEFDEARDVLRRVAGSDDYAAAYQAAIWRNLRAGFARPDVSKLTWSLAGALRRHRTLQAQDIMTVLAANGGHLRLIGAFD